MNRLSLAPGAGVVLLAFLPCFISAPAVGQECLPCHGDRTRLTELLAGKSREIGTLFVDAERFKTSVHGGQECGDCHMGYDEYPHSEDAEGPGCADCHEEAAESFAKSMHAQEREGQPDLPVACSSCHGIHDVLRASDRRSRMHPLNIYKVCGKCHFSIDPATATPDQILKEKYADDTHAFGLVKAGLAVSATCVSCHGGHEIRPASGPESRVARNHIDATCGTCHIGVVEEYHTSVHHEVSEGSEHRGATCSDCHEPHAISGPVPEFLLHSVAACSRCHEQRSGTFRKTYHGKVSDLGYGGTVATCESCHGSHAIFPASDPRSKVHPDNLVATCGACHPGAHPEFVNYLVHADPTDGEKYPLLNLIYLAMLSLIAFVVTFGLLHVGMWMTRSLIAKEWRHSHHGGRYLRIWPPFYVAVNVLFNTTILLLSATGVPLYFSEQPWAQRLIRALGGPGATAFLHRVAAVVLLVTFVILIGNLLYRLIVRRDKGLLMGHGTMLPQIKDVKDLFGNVRWFLGRGQKPRYDRWPYWEKFDFWAVFWGMAIMGISGLVLWFPEKSSYLMPAWMINVAGLIHGLEAMLAVAFHYAVQSFQSHLRPDKFPLDVSMFTGLISEEALREEKPLEYERLRDEGRLDDLVVPRPGATARVLAYGYGILAQCAGLFLLGGLIWAFSQTLA